MNMAVEKIRLITADSSGSSQIQRASTELDNED